MGSERDATLGNVAGQRVYLERGRAASEGRPPGEPAAAAMLPNRDGTLELHSQSAILYRAPERGAAGRGQRMIKVAVWGTGMMGQGLLGYILDRPKDIDLVGVIVTSPRKEGMTVGDLLGRETRAEL